MPLPTRPYFSISEAAARWGCYPADVAGWAAQGMLEILASVPMITAGDEELAGIVAVNPQDILPMFRRDGSGPKAITLHRVQRTDASPDDGWLRISAPEGGVSVDAADMLISSDQVGKFEEANDLGRRIGAATSAAKYDWDAMYVWIIKQIHDHGVPDTQSELVGQIQSWFARRGEPPDERTIRRRVKAVWQALREDG